MLQTVFNIDICVTEVLMKGRFPSDIAYISKDPRLLKQLKLPKEGENKQEKFKQPRILKQPRLL